MIADFLAGLIVAFGATLIIGPLLALVVSKLWNCDLSGGGMGGGGFITSLLKAAIGIFIMMGLPVGLVVYATLNGYINYSFFSNIVKQLLPVQMVAQHQTPQQGQQLGRGLQQR